MRPRPRSGARIGAHPRSPPAPSGFCRRSGVWDEIAPEAQPINDMVVTDSRTSDPVRPVFLTFDGAIEDGEPFAHMAPNVAMIAALRRQGL
jgi:2-polyprenyl-6-methoxyphenol hydroxylase-like FAD-dependent oxidoreductase